MSIRDAIGSVMVRAKKASFLVYALGGSIVFVAFAALQPFTDPANVMRDPLAVATTAGAECCSPLTGAASNVGVLFWIGAAAVLGFAALLAARAGAGRSASMAASAAAVTAVLGIDDLFMVHEYLSARLDTPEAAIFAVYGLIVFAYLAAFLKELRAAGPAALATSFAFFAISIAFDVLADGNYILEDGAKLLGIAAWAAFHVDLALSVAEASVRPISAAPSPRKAAAE